MKLRNFNDYQRLVPIHSNRIATRRERYLRVTTLGLLVLVGGYLSHCWVYYRVGIA